MSKKAYKGIENPERISQFRDQLKKIDWKETKNGLESVFEATNDLLEAEIKYYYRNRKRNKRNSFILRLIGFCAVSGKNHTVV